MGRDQQDFVVAHDLKGSFGCQTSRDLRHCILSRSDGAKLTLVFTRLQLRRCIAGIVKDARMSRADAATTIDKTHSRRSCAGLKRAYPDAICALAHANPYELLVATILSAQCTDVRVNMVTP